MNKVIFYTLGCKVNQYETEAMEELFEKDGYKVVKEEEIPDIHVINTCTVTNLSDRKSRQIIRRAKKINSDSIVAVVGCYSQVSPEEVSKIEGVDVIIGTTNRNDIVHLCERAYKEKTQINIVKNIKTQKEFETINIDTIKGRTRAYMKIQDGCNQFCTYCIIPYARGPIRSRDLEDILRETKKLSSEGFKEIVLTGIHIASYGKDNKKATLIKVLEEVAKVDGIERIRFSSIEPTLIDNEFMQDIIRIGKVCDYFHLSLQSGSDTVLRRMNRKYTTEQYSDIVDIIRRYMPDAGITTDIIVGFPGETESEFKETCDFVRKVGFSKIHVFKYSPRKGTPAAEYSEQLDGNIKNHRSSELINIGNNLLKDFNRKFVGRELSVLFEEQNIDGRSIEGYTTNYIRVKSKYEESLAKGIKSNYIGKIKSVYIDLLNEDYLESK